MPRRKSARRCQKDAKRAARHRARKLRAERVPSSWAQQASRPPSPSSAGPSSVAASPPPSVSGDAQVPAVRSGLRQSIASWVSRLRSKVHPAVPLAPTPPQTPPAKFDATLQIEVDPSLSDPGGLYPIMEDAMQLARLEDSRNLMVALRHVVRTLHPDGARVCFPCPELHDRLVLVSSGLPADPHELLRLIQRALRRRNQPFDFDEVYRSLVLAHGRVTMDLRKPWPECYSVSRIP